MRFWGRKGLAELAEKSMKNSYRKYLRTSDMECSHQNYDGALVGPLGAILMFLFIFSCQYSVTS